MYRHAVALLLTILFLMTSAAFADVVLDNFDSGDLSAWNTATPYYVTLGLVSPGNGGSGSALAITETAGAAHSISAYAHRAVSTGQNWTAYKTLKIDAKISAGYWNGYSVRLANGTGAAEVITFRGLHSTAAPETWVTFSLDISTAQRDQITGINIYPNRTVQNLAQTIAIDNIVLSTTPVTAPPDTMDYVDPNDYDLDRWKDPNSHVYVTTASTTAEPGAMTIATSASNTSAYGHCTPVLTQDWNDYVTLQFDAKLPADKNTIGYSVKIYRQGNPQSVTTNPPNDYDPGDPVKTKRFVPGSGSYATCYVDISGLERDQISSLMFYLNLRGLNTELGTHLNIDNIKLTKVPAPVTGPDVLTLESFETYAKSADMYGAGKPWDAGYGNGLDAATWPMLITTDMTLGLASMETKLSLIIPAPPALPYPSASAYVKRQYNLPGAPPSLYPDLSSFNSIMFDVKVIKNTSPMTVPMGFSCNIVDAGGTNLMFPFEPTAYDTWQTISLDISGNAFEYLSFIRFYDNRCGVGDIGQIFRIDNVRVSREPAPPVPPVSPIVDDFQGADNTSWFYADSVTGSVVADPTTGSNVLKIVNTGTNSAAYLRKTFHSNWSGFKTLSFDARMANSNTNQGFGVLLRKFDSNNAAHQFMPTSEWKTYSIDISAESITEMMGLRFYVNRAGLSGTSQSASQELYIDNIRLSTTAVQYNTIADAKNQSDGTTLTLTGKITMGKFPGIAPDPYLTGNPLRDVFFIEESDRSCALPVMIGPAAGAANVDMRSKVNVTGIMSSGRGSRFLYATSITNVDNTGVVVPQPVVLTNRNVGATDRWLAAGVPGFSGLDTTGMYAVVYGKILAIGTDSLGLYMYIDDGGRVVADNGATGLKVYDWYYTVAISENIGKYVRSVGFAMNLPELDTTGVPTGKIFRGFWTPYDSTEASLLYQ